MSTWESGSEIPEQPRPQVITHQLSRRPQHRLPLSTSPGKVSPAAVPLGRWANRGLAGICVACPLVPDPVSTHLSPCSCLSPTPSSQSVGPQGPLPGQSLRSRGMGCCPQGTPPGQQELVSPESSLCGAWLAVFLPILLREKGRLREGMGVAQSHTAPK